MIIYPHDPRYTFEIREDQPTDAVVVREIWCENVYEVFDGDLSDTHIAVDIGANIGAFSIYMHSLNPDAKVYAFEPEPHNLAVLRQNVELNKLQDHITIIDKAVGPYEGQVKISDEGGGSRVSQEGSVVQMTTLEQFWKDQNLEFIDVLKVDIEGYEYDVLLPTPKKLLDLCRFVVVEFDNHAEVGKFGQLVTKLAETHQLKIVGSELTGGYIYAHRY